MRSSEEIRKQAKALMDEFAAALKKVDSARIAIGVRREAGTRVASPMAPDPEFRDAMLRNAPRKKDGYIVSERKQH